MNIEVTKDIVIIDKESNKPHQEEYKITRCYFTFDEYINSCQNKAAIFTILSENKAYTSDIIDGECDIPNQVLKHEYDTVRLGVVGYDIETIDGEDVLKERYSPSYDTFTVAPGSYVEGAITPEEITPSQYEIYSAKLQEGLDTLNEAVSEIEQMDIDATKEGKVSTITITRKDGSQKQVTLEDGMGLNYIWQGTSLGVKREDEQNYQYTDLKGEKGDPGAIAFEIVQELPVTSIKEDTIYLVPYAIVTVQELPSIGTPHTIYIVSSTNKRYIFESGQWIEITSDNRYIEYIYVNNQWEELGGINVDVDLSDYYTKEETNTLLNGKQNVIDSSHKLNADLVDDANSTNKFTSTNEKSTWNSKYDKPNDGIPKTDLSSSVQESLDKADSAIQSSDLTDYVKNTDYATSSVAGVIKVTSGAGLEMVSSGVMRGTTVTYVNYPSMANYGVISKGTLENVITGKDLTTKAYVDGLVGDIDTLLTTLNSGNGV